MRPRVGGGGAIRPKRPQRDDPRQPNLGMPQQGPPMLQGVGPKPGMDFGMGQQFGQRKGGGFGASPNWQDRGFESKDAAQSVQRQYGLVQQPGGGFGKPDMAFLTRQMEANGWGPEFQRNSLNEQGTPINIGGARWYSGKNGVDFSGQLSDLAGGQAYDSAQQTPYGRTRRTRPTRTFGQVGY